MPSHTFGIEARILVKTPNERTGGDYPTFYTEIQVTANTETQAEETAIQYAEEYVASDRIEIITVYRKEYIL